MEPTAAAQKGWHWKEEQKRKNVSFHSPPASYLSSLSCLPRSQLANKDVICWVPTPEPRNTISNTVRDNSLINNAREQREETEKQDRLSGCSKLSRYLWWLGTRVGGWGRVLRKPTRSGNSSLFVELWHLVQTSSWTLLSLSVVDWWALIGHGLKFIQPS